MASSRAYLASQNSRPPIGNPLTGERIEFLAARGEDVLRLRLTVRRGGGLLRAHSHPRQEETIRVVRGALRFNCEGGEHTVIPAGEVFVVPAGIRHSWRNAARSATVAIIELRPALDAEQVFRLAFMRDGAKHARRRGTADERARTMIKE